MGIIRENPNPLSSFSVQSEILPSAYGDTANIDAFGRLRVSNPFTLFDHKQVFDDTAIAASSEHFPIFFDNQETSGSGTSTTFDVNRACTRLEVAASTAGIRIRQSKQRHNYQPGKSYEVILTGTTGSAPTGTGITKRWGLFDDNDGVFFQDDGGTWAVVTRTNATGTPVDTVVEQDDWNLDRLDGNGSSGITLNRNALQVFFFDLEWLGAGRIRWGFYISGIPVYCHAANHANVDTTVYMSTPNLPIRFEIENDGTGEADELEQNCTTVLSEGGIQPAGVFRSPDPATAAVNVIRANTIGETYVVAGMRLKTGFFGAAVVLSTLTLLGLSNDDFVWSVHFNPTAGSALTYTDVTDSGIQYAFGASANPGNSLTDAGISMAGGFTVKSEKITREVGIRSAVRLGSTIAGVSDEIVLCVTPLSSNLQVSGLLTWQEYW